MVFRVCGYKDIACRYEFVYTQALLASTKNSGNSFVIRNGASNAFVDTKCKNRSDPPRRK